VVGRIRALAVPLLFVAAYGLLGAAWALGTPPGAQPDADAHYIRAVAAGHGHLIGAPYNGPPLDTSRFNLGGARIFPVPAGLAAPSVFDCDAGQLDKPSTCSYTPADKRTLTSQLTTDGSYPPTPYIVPGILMRFAHGPITAEMLGRFGSLLVSLALLAAAVALLWTRELPVTPLIGLTLAITPLVIFLVSEVGPNGLEPMAALCFAAGLIRVSREGPVARWVWAAVGVSGAILSFNRAYGYLWMGLIAVVCAAVFGVRRTVGRLRRDVAGWGAVATILAGVLGAVAWQVKLGGHPWGTLAKTWSFVPGVVALLPKYVNDMVGVFGSADTPLPQPLVQPWIATVVAVIGIALVLGRRRESWAVAGLAVMAVVLVVAYGAAFDSISAGGLSFAQAHYFLPFAVLVPLFAGEVVARRADRLGNFRPARLFLYVAAIAGVVQFGSLYYDARRYAVGNQGSLLFFLPGHSSWAPRIGWLPVLLLGLVAAAALVAAAVADRRRWLPGEAAPVVATAAVQSGRALDLAARAT